MLVRLGACIPELNTSKCESLEENVYRRLDYNLSKAELLRCRGFTHIRYNNILGSGFSREELPSVLTSNRILQLKPWLCDANYTCSIHIPYKYNFFTINGAQKALSYIHDLCVLLDKLGLYNCALNMHVKCNYNQKEVFFKKFISKLDYNAKSRLVLENDDRILNMHQTLQISKRAKVGFVYDNLHDRLNPSKYTLAECLPKIADTWLYKNIKPVIHYSNGDKFGHNAILDGDELVGLLNTFKPYFNEVIVMVEIKNCVEEVERFRYRQDSRIAWLGDYRFII